MNLKSRVLYDKIQQLKHLSCRQVPLYMHPTVGQVWSKFTNRFVPQILLEVIEYLLVASVSRIALFV